MRVERAAQVLHDVLADDVVEVALADADQPGHDRQDDHQPDVQVQLLVLATDDDLVEQHAQQERIDQADQARGQDRDQDDHDLQAIGPEERHDPPERASASLLGNRGELGGGSAPHPAAADHPATAATAASRGAARGGPCAAAREPHYQAVAVAASVIPWASSQRSASMAALQPSPAAVTAWR